MFERLVHAPRHKRAFGFLAAVLMAVGAAEACDSTTTPEPSQTADGGGDPGSDARVATCPKVPPDAGTACSQPEGTTCAFGVCDGVYAVCSGGVWLNTPTTPVPSGCPEGVPSAGSSCPVCFSADASCLYQQACATDASAVRASCVSLSWQLVDETCAIEAGTGDAGGDGASADAADGD